MAASAFPSSADLPLSPDENNGVKLNPALEEREEDEFHRGSAPLKYMPLCDVYSATSPCVTATGSKKVKAAARKPPQINGHDQLKHRPITVKPRLTHVYSRRRKVKEEKPYFLEALAFRGLAVKSEELEVDGGGVGSAIKRRRVGTRTELMKLGIDFKSSSKSDDPTLLSDGFDKINSKNSRENCNVNSIVNNSKSRKRKNDCLETDLKNSGAFRTKKWVWYVFVFPVFKWIGCSNTEINDV